ncbi:MAG: GcvT family protein [Acidimicrobiales bacterium]
MSEVPSRADVVIVGAGIVGNSLAYHLARLGKTRILLIDKGPLPNPGGSTGHASNFIFPVEHSKMMTRFTQDAVDQYKALGVFTQSGGIEVARTEERLQEFKRRAVSAKAWGEEAYHLSPAEVKGYVPYINEDVIIGGIYFPAVGVVDSLRAGTLMREEAQRMGALTVLGGTEIAGIDVEGGRVTAVRTDGGDRIEAEMVAICCGVWSPKVARMAGATIPLYPTVHQMISVGPIARFADTAGEIEFPIVRDMDTGMYERQHGGDMEVGSYAHRPIVIAPEDIPSIEEAVLSPTELPFTQEDFDPQMRDALELMPEILGDERAGVRHAINGLISLTPDGLPAIGETPEVRGLWSVAASWIKEAPSIARTAAEWMVAGVTDIDVHEADIARFYPHQRTVSHVRARAEEGFNKTYAIVHPLEQFESVRSVRRSPMYSREEALGAEFFETVGWERPQWYGSNAPLLEEYAGRVSVRPAEWDARWWSPIIDAEHLAMRDRVGIVDLSSFAVFDVRGPGALSYIQHLALAQMDVGVGRVVYTPLLDVAGGFKADLTIMRMAADEFRVVTGGGLGMVDKKWFVDHLPGDGSVTLFDATSAWCTIGVWGPRARDLVGKLTDADISAQAFKYGTCKWIELGDIPVLASRISYVGELGWELYVPMDEGAHAWDLLFEAGQPLGAVPVGMGVYATTARIEKGYRAYGNELTPEYDPVEAGLHRRVVKKEDFVGKRAHLVQRSLPPAATLCTLSVDTSVSKGGVPRFPLGKEVIVTPDGDPISDRKGRPSYVTSAGFAPSVGQYLVMSYLPPELAVKDMRLAVECMGERYPVTVVVAGNGAVFDPENERMRA